MKFIAAALMLTFAGPALAASPDWYVAAPRFHACNKVSTQFTNMHTPEEVQDLFKHAGKILQLNRLSPMVVMLTDILDPSTEIVFFADGAACEAQVMAGIHLHDNKSY